MLMVKSEILHRKYMEMEDYLKRPDTLPAIFDHILLGYNERDPAKIKMHLSQAVTENVIFTDDIFDDKDLDGFTASMKRFRAIMPDAIYRITSGVQQKHHRIYRYCWALGNDSYAINGMDIYHLSENGKICNVDSWFGKLPDDNDSALVASIITSKTS